MAGFIAGEDRQQAVLFPDRLDDLVPADALVRVIDAFVAGLDLVALGFARARALGIGRPGYDPADLLRLYVYGYMNGVRSGRALERDCWRNLELAWLLRRLRPDFKTIADFRKDKGQWCCRRCGLPGVRSVCAGPGPDQRAGRGAPPCSRLHGDPDGAGRQPVCGGEQC